MNSIELFLGAKSWMARSSGPQAEAVRDLFGTDTLPCGFTVDADARVVLAEVARLNPGVRVYLRAEAVR